ncbi:hypothetical protein [Micromonospora aurantiaca (nom. illeg.)]|uniref:hypothetical protein n=1 Tax=Micromonospora aurantiaca (nom. illeg.) TaxID=47850 RepID=UPI0033E7BF36
MLLLGYGLLRLLDRLDGHSDKGAWAWNTGTRCSCSASSVSPLAGFLAIAVNLNLLPVGAALVLAGLLPLRVTPRPVA